MPLQSYKQLIVWQKSIFLVKEIYFLTKGFPRNELFGIISQIRRAAISIPSNIAEGYGRRSLKQYKQFYSISYGSALELETQLIISKQLQMSSSDKFERSERLLDEIIRMLYTMLYKRKGESLGRNS